MERKIKTGFTVCTHLSFVFLTFFFSVGCTLSYNITDLDQKYNSNGSSENDKTAPILSGTVIDGVSYGSLSTTPNLLWPDISEAKNGLDYYELALGSSAGGEEVLSWTKIGSTTNHAHSGLNLTKGRTYYPKIRAVDAYGNKSAAIFGDGWIATTLLSFLQPTYSLITGESITLGLTGGETPYTFQNSVSGYLNTTSGVYAAPLDIPPTSEQVSANDSVSQPAQSTINIRAFEEKDSFALDTTMPQHSATPAHAYIYNATTVFNVGYSNTNTSEQVWVVRKSTDNGDSWTTVDEFQLSSKKSAQALKITSSSDGTLFVTGVGYDNANHSHWITRKSTDVGNSWTTVDDFVLTTGQSSSGNSIKVDNAQNIIYTVGSSYDSLDGASHWIVRKSSDNGATWVTSDNFSAYSGYPSFASDIIIDNSSNVYVQGRVYDNSWKSIWITRKSSNFGSSWTTIDNYIFSVGYDSYSSGIAIASNGDLYAVGGGYDASGKSSSLIRKSTDSGLSWSTIDIYQYSAGKNSACTAVTTNNSGEIFVASDGVDASGWTHWIVRKSSDNGSTWGVIDDYKYSSSSHNYPYSLVADNTGFVLTTGVTPGNSPISTWRTRKTTNSGASWSNVDFYSYSGGTRSFAKSVTYDANNSTIYAFGTSAVAGSASVQHWITRKSSNNGSTWQTIDDFQLSPGVSAGTASKISVINGSIYLLGYAYNASSYPYWVIRKSSDNGISWNNVDTWILSAGIGRASQPTDIILLSTGDILAVGSAIDATAARHSIIKKSTDNGNNWSIIDDYQFASGKSVTTEAIAKDTNNNLFVVGQYVDSSNSRFWYARKSSDNGTTWNIVDSFQLSTNKDASAYSIYVNSANEIFVVGEAQDATSSRHWIVRKSTNAGTSWNNVDNFQLIANGYNVPYTITADADGNLFVGGFGRNSSSLFTQVIRVSRNNGLDWNTVFSPPTVNVTDFPIVNSLAPCLNRQICSAGSSIRSNRIGNVRFTIDILSP